MHKEANMSMQTDEYDYEMCDDYKAFFLKPTLSMSTAITGNKMLDRCPMDIDRYSTMGMVEGKDVNPTVNIEALQMVEQSQWTAEYDDSVHMGMSTDEEYGTDCACM